MRFNYDDNITQKLTNKALINLFLTIVSLIAICVLFSSWVSSLSYYEANKLTSNPNLILLFAAIILTTTIGFRNSSLPAIASECLKTNYIEVTPSSLNGTICENLKSKDNTRYISLRAEEILKVEKAPLDSSYYTLLIYTKNETYHICIENADMAISQIINFASGQISAQVYQCPVCSQTVYFGQEKCTCGQKFDWTKLQI